MFAPYIYEIHQKPREAPRAVDCFSVIIFSFCTTDKANIVAVKSGAYLISREIQITDIFLIFCVQGNKVVMVASVLLLAYGLVLLFSQCRGRVPTDGAFFRRGRLSK
jgi:hypothetical protein